MRIGQLRQEAASAVRAMRAALEVVRERSNSEQITRKGHLDIATGTDLASQEAIRAVLERHPQHQFVGEEAGQDQLPSTGSYWLVDPICGTRNFASRLPLYGINIALVEQGRVVVSAVGDGALGYVYVAERGRGAWAIAGEVLERMVVSDHSALMLIDPGRTSGPGSEKASAVIAAALRAGRWEIRTLGTSLDLAYLASGSVAGVWHFSRIPALHFAAGTLLASEAGAIVTDDQGVPWGLGSESLVAASTLAIHRGMLDLMPA